jgi:hypothetical protein
MGIKYVKVDFSNLKSLKSAEKKKMMLERDGYNNVGTKQIGFNKFILEYKKKKLKKVV